MTAQNYNSRKFGLKMQLKILSTIYFHKTNVLFQDSAKWFSANRDSEKRVSANPVSANRKNTESGKDRAAAGTRVRDGYPGNKLPG